MFFINQRIILLKYYKAILQAEMELNFQQTLEEEIKSESFGIILDIFMLLQCH